MGLQGRTVIGQCRFPGRPSLGLKRSLTILTLIINATRSGRSKRTAMARLAPTQRRNGSYVRLCRACHAAGRSSSFHTRPCVAFPHFVLQRRGDDGIDGRWARPRLTMAAAAGVAFSLLTRRRTTAGKREKLLCRQPQGAPQAMVSRRCAVPWAAGRHRVVGGLSIL